jgi:hypothetical protein
MQPEQHTATLHTRRLIFFPDCVAIPARNPQQKHHKLEPVVSLKFACWCRLPPPPRRRPACDAEPRRRPTPRRHRRPLSAPSARGLLRICERTSRSLSQKEQKVAMIGVFNISATIKTTATIDMISGSLTVWHGLCGTAPAAGSCGRPS